MPGLENTPTPEITPTPLQTPPSPSPTPEPVPPTVEPPAPPVTPQEAAAIFDKIRLDEKNKHQRLIAKEQSENASLRVQNAQLQAQLAQAQQPKVEPPAPTANPEITAFAAQLNTITEAVTKLTKEIASTQQKVTSQELDVFRDAKIKELGVIDASMVSGSTREEIEASAKAALAAQTNMRAVIEAQVRKELGANVPGPLGAVDGPDVDPTSPIGKLQDTVALRSMAPEEFNKLFQAALIEAKTARS